MSFGEKFSSNQATVRKAAKYVVDRNMTISEATKKATSEARRNTAIAVAAMGAYTVSQIYRATR